MHCCMLLVLTAVAAGNAQLLLFSSVICPVLDLSCQNLACSQTGIPFPCFGGVCELEEFGICFGGTLMDQLYAVEGILGSCQNGFNPTLRVPEGGQGLGYGCACFGGGSAVQGGNFGYCSAGGQLYAPIEAPNEPFTGITGMSVEYLGGMGFPEYCFGGYSALGDSDFGEFGMNNGLGMEGIGSTIPTYYSCGYIQNSTSGAPRGQCGNANPGFTAGSATSYGIPSFGQNCPFNDPLFGDADAYSQRSPFMGTSSQFGSGLASGNMPGSAKPCSVGPPSCQRSTPFYDYNNPQANQQYAFQSASSNPVTDNQGGSTNGFSSRLSRQSSCGGSKCLLSMAADDVR